MLPEIKYDKALLGKLKSCYFNAKALYETIKENAEYIERKILEENAFYETEDIAAMENRKPRRIYEPSNTYNMDLDKELPRFLDLCYPEYIKAGIADPRGKEYCPDAQARSLLHESENQLIEFAIEIIPSEFEEKKILRKAVQMLKYRNKVLDLVLRLESNEVENYAK